MVRLDSLVPLLGGLALMLFTAPAGLAAPPSNDNLAGATAISSLPFTANVDLAEATIEPGEPIADPNQIGRTVWYSLTPAADGVVTTARPDNPPGPNPPTLCELRSSQFLVVYQADGPGFAGLTAIAGSQWSNMMANTLRVHAGTTYYFQGGQRGGFADPGCPPFALRVAAVAPPPNDDFAAAIPFTAVPFSDARDLTAASVEPGEPTPCGTSFTQSAWYAFTPTTTGAYGGYWAGNVNVYTGTSLADLTPVACSDWTGLYFHADAGTTYYLQTYGWGVIRVDAVPPPLVGFLFSPTNPATSDDVSFRYWIGGYWDPTVTGQSWDFGDGTSATGATVTHRFATPGDHAVTLTVSALGGRTATQTQTVHVTDRTPPVLGLPGDQTAEATSAAGAVVTYTVTATDDSGVAPTVVCTPSSGSVFPFGSTIVSCTASDASGNSAEGSFTVTVADTTPPTLDLPEAVVADATAPAGATVSFEATATDAVDPSPSVACDRASGSLFAIGTTTVTCTATDTSGNRATGSFAVTVKGAVEQLADLAAGVAFLGPGSSLADKVAEAEWFVAHGQPGSACSTLTSFTRELRAQSDKKIALAQVVSLTADAMRIETVLGCGS